ncbi:hypothetical protein MKW98_016627 [Papaver atlanticum]|uniref:Uncharacterized protein n=1 Tax=Papaver atlanticum TaxID=357466 RepID=A0AAD4SQW1_9MAGN|nr:hypothetical protein MKW98_016627 [Papaver atlanticum]
MCKIDLKFHLLETLIPPNSTSVHNLSMILRQSGAFPKRLIFNLELWACVPCSCWCNRTLCAMQYSLGDAAA